ncbi:hypothetical protein [Bradyrhizobium sp. CCBAU 25338]|uniref:hypothetical protein n=1 Tax=Bradyrhizobium sp. CCBAU 25338 TaxID=1641877 RepID=UPI0023049F40|nr:hypothetical protein [Bradyrhizobium sp. CCBAU 25338]MDA9529799.1 hypothetical protein [Bradyrhizobium sp. CCBAU 25338]
MSDFGTDPYHDLPEDPEEAFLRLETHFRAECDRHLAALDQNDRTDVVYVDYIAKVLAAIKALELEGEFKSEVPSIEDVNFTTYLNFNKDVMHYCTMLRIRRSQREQGYSVQFDDTARRKVHHHLDQVLDIFQKLEIDDRKREKLISRLNDLQGEVEQRRTRFDRFAALTMEVAGVVGDATERSKIIDIFDAIGRVFWGAQTEKQKQLPAPTQRKIEPPKPKIEEKKPPSNMDDDIPF